MNTMEELRKYLISEFNADFKKDSIDPDENLLNRGIIDSLGIMKLIAFMEKAFNIKIANEDVIPENFQSLNSLNQFITRKKQM